MLRIVFVGAVLFISAWFASPADAAGEQLMTRLDELGAAARSCDNGSQIMCTVTENNLSLIPAVIRESIRANAQSACDRHGEGGCWQLGLDMILEAAALPLAGDVPSVRKRELQKAERLFHDACQGGSLEACRQVIIGEGWLAPRTTDKPKLVANMKQLCDENLATACFSLGQALQVGFNDFPLDPVQGRQALAKGCNLGEARACNLVARALEAHEMNWTGPKAFPELFTIACDRGSSVACVTLAERYVQNPGLPQAAELAAKAWETGCSLANGGACAQFAQILLDGVRGPADPVRAKVLFAAACPSGPKTACFSASTLILKGEPGPQDLLQARNILLAGCSKGQDLECARIGEVEKRLIAEHQHFGARGPILVSMAQPGHPATPTTFSDVRFTVTADGSVKGCFANGGGTEFDKVVCTVVTQSKYVPAIDANGKNQPTSLHMGFKG